MGIREQGMAEHRTRGRARPPPPMAVTDRTQQKEQTSPSGPRRARGLVKLPSPRCSRHTSLATGGGTATPRPGLPRPRWGPKGLDLGRADAARVTALPHRQEAASSSPGHPSARPCRAPPPPERRRPVGTAAGRGESRASLSSEQVEARPSPPAPRGLCPVACADGGGGRRRRRRGAWRLGFLCPDDRPRGTMRGCFFSHSETKAILSNKSEKLPK
jgi:hypothetical protein